MSVGIKETIEVISFLKSLSLAIESSMKDGKVDIFDTMQAIQLAPSLMAAVNGIDHVKEEIKDLDQKEKDMIIQEMQDAVFLFIRAVKSAKSK